MFMRKDCAAAASRGLRLGDSPARLSAAGLSARGVGRPGFVAFFVSLAGLLSSGCAVTQPRGDGQLDRLVEPTTKRGYWRYLPVGYVRSDEAQRAARHWPLVVSFHGMKPFDSARPQALEWEFEADRYGFIVVAPELEAPDVLQQFPVRTVHPAFQRDETATLAILEHLFSTTRADRRNVLATSWSSGGYMAHYMLNRHPERFTCLGVRQSNFSASVLDGASVARSRNSPVLIVYTQHDFGICQRESRAAIEWYEQHEYPRLSWVMLNRLGHERTPDIAADFFAKVAGVEPASPPEVLVQRQAIDGNPSGLALLASNFARNHRDSAPTNVRPPPLVLNQPRGASGEPARPPTAQRPLLVAGNPASAAPSAGGAARGAAAAKPRVSIYVSSAIGVAPLLLGFSAYCPPDWHGSADFLWSLDGQTICKGVNGQKTLTDPGQYTLGLLVVTKDGQEFRDTRTINVLTLDTSRPSGR